MKIRRVLPAIFALLLLPYACHAREISPAALHADLPAAGAKGSQVKTILGDDPSLPADVAPSHVTLAPYSCWVSSVQ